MIKSNCERNRSKEGTFTIFFSKFSMIIFQCGRLCDFVWFDLRFKAESQKASP